MRTLDDPMQTSASSKFRMLSQHEMHEIISKSAARIRLIMWENRELRRKERLHKLP